VKKKLLQARIALVLLMGGVVTIMPTATFARMPNPDTRPYPDHTKVVTLGVDAARQVFAYATVSPLQSKNYRVQFRCEHGDTGDSHANYTVKFREGNVDLFTVSQRCDVGSVAAINSIKVGHNKYDEPYHRDVDLSSVIDKVDNIQLFANLGSGPSPGMVCVKMEGPASCVEWRLQ